MYFFKFPFIGVAAIVEIPLNECTHSCCPCRNLFIFPCRGEYFTLFPSKKIEKSFHFLIFLEEFKMFLRFLMKNTNYFVNFMINAKLWGKSLFLAFWKGFLCMRKIFSPALGEIVGQRPRE